MSDAILKIRDGERIVLDADTAAFLLSRDFAEHLHRCTDCGREHFTDSGPCFDCAARRQELAA